jgi:hypothetical protein
VSVSRSTFALVDDRDRAYFGGRGREEQDQIGYIDANTRAIFGRSYAAEPDALVKQLAVDEAIAAADTLLLTVPNQLGNRLQRSRARKHLEVRGAGARLALSRSRVRAQSAELLERRGHVRASAWRLCSPLGAVFLRTS